jgi:hypothetical protein
MLEKISTQAPPFDAISAFGIGGLAILMALLCVFIFAQKNRRRLMLLGGGTILWLGFSAAAARSGILTRTDILPPPFVILLLSFFTLAFVLGFSSLGKSVAANIPFVILVGLQSFRFPLELIMHRAYEKKIMPVQLSFSGYNFDLLTGLGALILLLLLLFKPELPKLLIWIWNVWGIYCLIAIAYIAITGSVLVQGFGSEPENLNTWVLFFPYVWLPAVLVTIAIVGHIVITRKLLLHKIK